MSRLIFEIEICLNLVTLSRLIFPQYNLNIRLIVLQKSSSLRKILPTDTCPTMHSSSHLTNSHLRCQETQPIFARVDGCVALPSCQLSLINCFIFQHYSLRICYGISIILRVPPLIPFFVTKIFLYHCFHPLFYPASNRCHQFMTFEGPPIVLPSADDINCITLYC